MVTEELLLEQPKRTNWERAHALPPNHSFQDAWEGALLECSFSHTNSQRSNPGSLFHRKPPKRRYFLVQSFHSLDPSGSSLRPLARCAHLDRPPAISLRLLPNWYKGIIGSFVALCGTMSVQIIVLTVKELDLGVWHKLVGSLNYPSLNYPPPKKYSSKLCH